MIDEPVMQSEGTRRAALALHALSAADRDWLLAQLQPQQQLALRSSLEELQELGIPPDGEIIRRALDERSVSPAPAPMHEEAARLCRLLEQETPGVRELMVSSASAELAAAIQQCWTLSHELVPQHRAETVPSAAVREAVLDAWRKLAQKAGGTP